MAPRSQKTCSRNWSSYLSVHRSKVSAQFWPQSSAFQISEVGAYTIFWEVECAVRVLRVQDLNQQHQHHWGELARDASSQPTPESETLGVRSAIPVLMWPLGGFTLQGEKNCCRTGLAEAKSPRRKTPELNPCSFRPCTSSENLQSLSVLFYKMGIISESTI